MERQAESSLQAFDSKQGPCAAAQMRPTARQPDPSRAHRHHTTHLAAHLHAEAQVAQGGAAALPADSTVGLQLRDQGVDVAAARLKYDLLRISHYQLDESPRFCTLLVYYPASCLKSAA